MEKKYIRICKICGKEISYKTEKGLIKAEKKGIINCRSCSCKIAQNKPEIKEHNRIMNSGKNNAMYGKTFYNIWIEKYNEDEIKFKKNQLSKKHSIISINQSKQSNYDVWLQKYGKEIADQKLLESKQKQSIASSGENNPMFGKPSPQGSGNGWSGHYQNHYFRSLLELHYLIYLLDNNINFESGEKRKYAIQYEMDGIKRNYFPDYYLIDKDQYIEIKPTALVNSYQNKLKFKAAKNKLGDKHIILTEEQIIKIDLQKLYNMYINKEIIFDKRYVERFEEYYNKNRKKEEL